MALRARVQTALARGLAAFRIATDGLAAVEFALILPLMLVVFIGASTVGDGVMASRKLSLATRTLVDLASQEPTSFAALSTPAPPNAIPVSELDTVLAAAATLMTPQPTASLKMTLSAVEVSANPLTGFCCKALVRWSYTKGGTLRPCNQLITGIAGLIYSTTQLPAELLPIGQILPQTLSYLIADASYTYQPVVASTLMRFAPAMQRTTYMMPRTSGRVVVKGPMPTGGATSGAICY